MGKLMQIAQDAVNAAWTWRHKPSVEKQTLLPAHSDRGWWPIIHEPFSQAWQRNLEVKAETVASCSAAYACITLIMSDIGKLRMRLVEQDDNGIWNETTNAAFSPVLRRPNRYQNSIQFFENWMASKLFHGNTYVLKARDERGIVTALYILDPCRTSVQVSDDGTVLYEVRRDNLSGIEVESLKIPATEIIHDRMNALYHPLVGVSPITASAIAVSHSLNIQRSSAAFFGNGARPAGILTTVSPISDERAQFYQERWNQQYKHGGLGGTAVLGGDWKYIPMTMTAVDTQLIDQLRITSENICTAFKVPPYMIGVGPDPSFNNIEALNQRYYSQCIQVHTEEIERVLDDGLGLGQPRNRYGTEFDLGDLLRMDTSTRVKAAADAIGSGAMAPNEARKRYFDLGPVKGGESPYLQQQNFSLAALDERDRDKPFAKPEPAPAAAPASTGEQDDEEDTADGGAEQSRAIVSELYHRAAQFDARDAA